MSAPLRAAPAAFEARILAQTRMWLREDEAFLAATAPRERCASACRGLRLAHRPEYPFPLIDQLLNIDPGSVARHWKIYKERLNASSPMDRPSILRPSLVITLKTFEDELMLFRYTEEEVDIYDQPKAHIDRDIFTI
jgi:hypothetical protein